MPSQPPTLPPTGSGWGTGLPLQAPPPEKKRATWPIAVLVVMLALLAVVLTVVFVGPKLETAATTDTGPVGVLPTARHTEAPSTTRGAGGDSGDPASPSSTEPRESTTTTTRPPPTTLHIPTNAELLGEDFEESQLVKPPKPAAQGSTSPLYPGSSGKAAGWDPCRTIHYIVHLGGGPANGLALIQEALRNVEAISGLHFKYEGTTNDIPQWTAPTGPVPDVSKAFDPVFIGWANKQQTDIWAHEGKDILGVGSPRRVVFDSGDALFVSGSVVLLPVDYLAPKFGKGATVGNVLQHEIGHLVGLDHVDSETELMAPTLTETTRDGYGPGDKQGLWSQGAQRGCASAWLHM